MQDHNCALKKTIREVLNEVEADKVLPLEVRRLRLEPGDSLVLRVPGRISEAAVDYFRHGLQQTFPGARVFVLEDGAALEVLSSADAPPQN